MHEDGPTFSSTLALDHFAFEPRALSLAKMLGVDVRALRSTLGVSRSEFGRFLGVSEATIVRWESDDTVTEPKGLQAVLLRAIEDAVTNRSPRDVARLLRSCIIDHRSALQQLLLAAE